MNAHSFSNKRRPKLSRKSSTLIDRKQNGKISYFVYLSGNPMISPLTCYQGLAVDAYGFALDAADMGHPRLSLI
jgi:hypothetical protein